MQISSSHNNSAIHRWFIAVLLYAGLLFPVVPGSFAQSQPPAGTISIEKGGQLWIEGSAGLIDYRCTAEKLSGAGKINTPSNPASSVGAHGDVHISVVLPVESLNCGKRAMNKDMYEALKARSHPNIRFILLNADREKNNGTNEDSSWIFIRTRGLMEIAGVQDTTVLLVKGKVLSEKRFRVKGSKKIYMDTYNITPPSAMFGLIRADKELTVHFDVTVHLASASGY